VAGAHCPMARVDIRILNGFGDSLGPNHQHRSGIVLSSPGFSEVRYRRWVPGCPRAACQMSDINGEFPPYPRAGAGA
jgi:hypothetical protein